MHRFVLHGGKQDNLSFRGTQRLSLIYERGSGKMTCYKCECVPSIHPFSEILSLFCMHGCEIFKLHVLESMCPFL